MDERNRIGADETPSTTEAAAVDADGDVEILGVTELRMMASAASDLPVPGKDRVPEQQSTELDLGVRLRIVGGRCERLGKGC